MFFKRSLSNPLKRYEQFPVVAILGPRQSGKTVLAKHHFHKHAYVNLENPEQRLFAQEDPNRFLKEFNNKHGVIIDEFQYTPQLLSYIQEAVDARKRKGFYVLTGSQNFLVNQAISQSLAGRVGILTLLPLSLHELEVNKLKEDIDSTIFNGSYPGKYEADILPGDLYPSYIQTYLERDVRQIAQVGDLSLFQKLMKLCAARIGQLFNIADLATHLGVDQRKVKQWIAVLEASYIIFLLKPYHNNFNKRLTKTPKLYFYDTGLACSLLDIKKKETLSSSPYRGCLFESLIIADFHKQYYHNGLGQPPLYFWRDQNGRLEVDCLIDRGDKLLAVEVKSSETISPSFFTSLSQWIDLAGIDPQQATVVYGGNKKSQRSTARILGWEHAAQFVKLYAA